MEGGVAHSHQPAPRVAHDVHLFDAYGLAHRLQVGHVLFQCIAGSLLGRATRAPCAPLVIDDHRKLGTGKLLKADHVFAGHAWSAVDGEKRISCLRIARDPGVQRDALGGHLALLDKWLVDRRSLNVPRLAACGHDGRQDEDDQKAQDPLRTAHIASPESGLCTGASSSNSVT